MEQESLEEEKRLALSKKRTDKMMDIKANRRSSLTSKERKVNRLRLLEASSRARTEALIRFRRECMYGRTPNGPDGDSSAPDDIGANDI